MQDKRWLQHRYPLCNTVSVAMPAYRIQIQSAICCFWLCRYLTGSFETTMHLRFNKLASSNGRRLIAARCNTTRRIAHHFPFSRRLVSTSASANDQGDETNEYTKSYKLSGMGNGPGVSVTTNTGHTIQTDLPKTMGGKNLAPQPVETLLAAWMGCTQATAVFVGRHMEPHRLLVDELHFHNIQGFRDERGALQLPLKQKDVAARGLKSSSDSDDDDSTPSTIPSRLQRVTGTIYVFAKASRRDKEYVPLSTEQLDLLKHQTEARCPVANMMIASGCAVDVEWLDGSTTM